MKINECITPMDRHIVQKIYIPHRSTEDVYVWSYTQDGNYTVKSGYWLICSQSVEEEDQKPPLATSPDIAQGIWRLDISPKLKHFLLRKVSRAIAVSKNFRHRNVMVNPYCPRCCNEAETSNHAFFTRKYAEAIWKLSGIPTSMINDVNVPIEDKIRVLISLHQDQQMEESIQLLPINIMWRLWKNCN